MNDRRGYTRRQRRQRAIWKRRILIGGMLAVLLLIVGGISALISANNDVKSTNQNQNVTEDSEEQNQESVPEEPQPEPVVIEPKKVTLSFAGDCTLGTDLDYGYGNTFMEAAQEKPSDFFFANVANIFAQDDLTVVNLEGPLTDGSDDAEKTFAFKGELSYVDILLDGNVEVVNLANNHSYDYGVEGYEDTLAATEEAGIVAYGYDNIQIVDVEGVKVGFVGMFELKEGIAIKEEMIQLIDKVEAQGADVVVVSFHWGIEKDHYPTDVQTELAHAAIDSGADLIVGHHPHVLQGIEEYKGKYIVYSLGNFCFGGNRNPADKDTIIYQQTFTVDGDGLKADADINIIPCSVSSVQSSNNFQPTPLTGEEKDRVAQKLNDVSMTDISGFISE